MDIYDIEYIIDDKTEKITCANISLKGYQKWIEDNGGKITTLEKRPKPRKKYKK